VHLEFESNCFHCIVFMQFIERFVPRRVVIEAYLRYDTSKKNNNPMPPIDTWNWDDPNALDNELKRAKFKCGILAGFLEWCAVLLTIEDLRSCAVVISMSEGRHRDLRSLELYGFLKNPPEYKSWLAKILVGGVFEKDEPMILRPAVNSEYPAQWYLEDGSGRASAIVKNADTYQKNQIVAFAYLGTKPAPKSHFMKTRFPSLLSGLVA
jgi:hypothetical protein